MLSKGMYVRCSADRESATDPRVFICAQVKRVDEFNQTITVEAHDPFKVSSFFEELPKGALTYPLDAVCKCRLFPKSNVVVEGDVCEVIAAASHVDDSDFCCYYVQRKSDKEFFKVSEKEIVASLLNGDVDPTVQLKNYEFQNPMWYLRRAVVSESMNVLDNSIYGFKQLAGSKIRLLPHQVNTVMRCLQEKPCRFLLADEVGMGKTIEALSILKIYSHDNANKEILILVPSTLKEQWKNELLLKFDTPLGMGENGNRISVLTVDELRSDANKKCWDFLVVDEVHRYISNDDGSYDLIHSLSMSSENVLLLSATPVQRRKEEYLNLLRLLQPEKYDSYSLDYFSSLVDKQGKIIQKTALVLDDLEDYIEELAESSAKGENPHSSDDCKEVFEEICDDLTEICDALGDAKLSDLLDNIDFDSQDCGVLAIRVFTSYVCGNYQLESNIIRNRRKILEAEEDETRSLPIRKLYEIGYDLDKDRNTHETLCYQLILDWIDRRTESASVDDFIKPLLGAFFSSPWALCALLKRWEDEGVEVDQNLADCASRWQRDEDFIVDHAKEILEDPFSYESEFNTRIACVLNAINEDLYDKKIVLFTNFPETFAAYQAAFELLYPSDEVSFFGKDMPPDEIELQAYAFQIDPKCRLMLCDYSGGEGRNFQCADYVVHIDLPWDANQIEQRIGRLDRLERDASRPVVTSVVVHTQNSFESALFSFWNEGLKIFNQSLSGMEIITKDVNREITSAVKADVRYGLVDRIPSIIVAVDQMRDEVRKEQNYDAAGFVYRPLFVELRRLIDFYARNEEGLFAKAMSGWASMAGFKGHKDEDGVVTYSENSFSLASAMNSMLIPPRWDEYLSKGNNKFISEVQASYQKRKGTWRQSRSIQGTFMREIALKNDYLHFFAPGDAVFDCIVSNAMNSCKGRASAFSYRSSINWKGLVFVWSLSPDETYLLDNGVSLYALAPYRSYLVSNQIVVPISIYNPDSLSDTDILREYQRLIGSQYKQSVKHLGKRGGASFAGGRGQSAISMFRERFPEDAWCEFVEKARGVAQKKAYAIVRHYSNVGKARDEMDRVLSSREAQIALYGGSPEEIDALREEQRIVLEALRRPKVALDSAVYIEMAK
ncbi:SNF2-related protein [Slackia exigua]|uniref:SNF2-related protein n=1 Tax=Slackia exigua TaxID=84109 RepID=UPI00210ECD50|nr:SNF2-related protein [Slackia exigua]MCQ5090955.1 SNF2-related protein [Slackia exigua]